MDFNVSIEREASFEVSRKSTMKKDESQISDFEPFPLDVVEGDFLSKWDGEAKASNGFSPDKVTDFDDGFPPAVDFPQTPSSQDSRNNSDGFDLIINDPWGDKSNEFNQQNKEQHEQQEQEQLKQSPRELDSLGFDPVENDLNNESTSKVLFPDDKESNLNKSREQVTGEISSTFTPNLTSIIKQRYEDEKGAHTVGSLSDVGDEQSGRSRSSDLKESSGRGAESLFSANCITLPIFMSGNKKESNVNGKSKEGIKDGPSTWERLMANLPDEKVVKEKILKVQKTIMACQEPDPVVVFDGNIDPSSVHQSDPSKKQNEGNETVVTESAFSVKSLSTAMIETGQDLLSIASNASTTCHSQAKGKANLRRDNEDNPSNATLKLCIDLYEEHAFQTLMVNLEGNAQVKELQIFRSWDQNKERTRTTEDISLLFRTIKSLPNLEMLNLANFLVEEIHFVSLTERQNTNLRSIRIHLCRGTVSKSLLEVLARLPSLQELTLEMNQSFPFHLLLRSESLESLTIVANDYNIDNLHAHELIQKIPKNETLKKLTIEPPLRLRTFKLIAAALRKNNRMECLQFSLLPGNQLDTDRAMIELANTLLHNATLKSIRNLNHSKISVKDRTCDVVMKSLSENYIMEEFLVFDEEKWFKERKETILKENKMEYEALYPHVFNCGDNTEVDQSDYDNNANSIVVDESSQSVSASVGTSLASLGDNVKSKAKRVASDALNYVGQNIGLK